MKIGELIALLDRLPEDIKRDKIVLFVHGKDYEVESVGVRNGALVLTAE